MADPLLRLGSLFCCLVGMGWFAIAMMPHWRQLRSVQPLRRATRVQLRALGGVALALALALCLRVDHPSMAALVWVMTLAASALSVAFTLAWRPQWLSWLVIWVRRDERAGSTR